MMAFANSIIPCACCCSEERSTGRWLYRNVLIAHCIGIRITPNTAPQVLLLRTSLLDKVAFEYTLGAGVTAAGASTSSGHAGAGVKKVVTWRDLNNKELTVPGINLPSDVALGAHARFAFNFAIRYGWCTKSDLPALGYGDSLILQQFLADLRSSSGGAGAGGAPVWAPSLGGTTGSEMGGSSQVPNLEGAGET
ncbi:hypothetical protein Vretifemale_5061 [Volvox reticuliferus]|uniref:Uncharacterized protein n=1 Tax=Volvox reticuliferus TaxID=1737510 RepID=A0A8J4CAK1_9CHLO|nr:hypothetical protein Vretifemale_5061 [Volvox reticuliferus]